MGDCKQRENVMGEAKRCMGDNDRTGNVEIYIHKVKKKREREVKKRTKTHKKKNLMNMCHLYGMFMNNFIQ